MSTGHACMHTDSLRKESREWVEQVPKPGCYKEKETGLESTFCVSQRLFPHEEAAY
jgi:hypothetical protein